MARSPRASILKRTDQADIKAFCGGGGTGGDGPASGKVAIRACESTHSGAAAFIDLVRSQGDEFVMPLLANAVPSGIVAGAALESMAESVIAEV